jgi:hypothetical protein
VRRLIALGLVGLVLVLLIAAQLVLPGVAEQRLRSELSRSGTVLSVSVSAFPAIRLLWQRADHVVVRMGRYQSGASGLGDSLARTANVGTVDASAQEVQSGVLVLHDATLHKRGNELTGTATLMNADLRSAVPFLTDVAPLESSGGRLVLRGTASVLGLNATVDAIVAASNGALVVAPDVPFGGIATITLFSDPRVQVQSVSATSVPGGFTLTARGRLP